MRVETLSIHQGSLMRKGVPWIPRAPFLAVVGRPVSHSQSPVMQRAALAARDLDHEYLALDVSAEDLAGLPQCPGVEHLVGFNVTAPHKKAVVPLCEQFTEAAARLGVVNTVGRAADGAWVGHNTDSGGLFMVLSQAWAGEDPADRAVVLGTGGAARAAVDALARWGSGVIEVQYHSTVGAEGFAGWVGDMPYADTVKLEPLVAEPEGPAAAATVWINALARHIAVSPFLPVAAGPQRSLLVDLRYGSGLPVEHFPLGFQVVDGLPLLVMQGGLSFAWWFGPPVPWDDMRKVL